MERHKARLFHLFSRFFYLDKLDKFVEQTLIPEYTLGQRRAENPEYSKLQKLAWYFRKTGLTQRARELEIQYQLMPSKDVRDPEYRSHDGSLKSHIDINGNTLSSRVPVNWQARFRTGGVEQ